MTQICTRRQSYTHPPFHPLTRSYTAPSTRGVPDPNLSDPGPLPTPHNTRSTTQRADPLSKMSDNEVTDPQLAADLKKRRSFRTFSYRGVELEKLLDLSNEDFVELVHARARRRFQRGLKRRPMGLIKKLRKAKKEAPPNEKPAMIGSVVGIYNGKVFNSVEIKPEMTGHYLAEFSISYKPVKHGRPGIGATHSSRFIPLK
ncbi:ribosomal protein S19 [Rhizoctonia solani]|uniref:Ribosomal protein S19 n=1 Tax=Rhizoctonia solani TaxID=456999 RepID=A0A8H8NR38_9AGAM|nr:ribosomal protein S19 [Rhizoctonia solani]QRW17193.1 ribosomal protein S19 [Rhizoctonia solani]